MKENTWKLSSRSFEARCKEIWESGRIRVLLSKTLRALSRKVVIRKQGDTEQLTPAPGVRKCYYCP